MTALEQAIKEICDVFPGTYERLMGIAALAREEGAEQEAAKIVHCGECRYAEWETQEPFGKGEGIACHVIAGRSRPWLGAAMDYCSEGRRKEEKP